MADNEDPKSNIAPVTTPKPVEAKPAAQVKAPEAAVPEKPKAEVSKPIVAAVVPKVAKPEVPAPVKVEAPAKVEVPKPVAAKVASAPAKVPVAEAAPIKAPASKAPAAKVAAPKSKIKAAPVALAKPKPVVPVVPAKVATAKPAIKVAKDVKETVAAVPVPKAATPTAAPKTAPKPVSGKPVFAGLFSNFMLEETTMDMSANFTGFQDAITEAQAKAKAAFEKSTSVLGEVSDFAKGNVEAAVESGKIYAEGVQAMGSELVSESRAAFEKMSGDIKELAAAKSPTDFFKLQSDLVRKNFDTAVAYSSKNSEAMLKLMSDTFAPISGRVSIAVEKARSAAPF